MADSQTPTPQMIFLPIGKRQSEERAMLQLWAALTGGQKPAQSCNCTACLMALTDKQRAQKPVQKPVEPSWSDAEVCTDCYMAHHFGWHEHEGQWFSGESDEPCDREPLNLLSRHTLADNVNSETEDGLITFSWRACEGCGSNLGGSRFSLRAFT